MLIQQLSHNIPRTDEINWNAIQTSLCDPLHMLSPLKTKLYNDEDFKIRQII